MTREPNPFRIPVTDLSLPPWLSMLIRPIWPLLTWFIGLNALAKRYKLLIQRSTSTPSLQDLLDELGCKYKIIGNGYQEIPLKGPVIVVSNHPFGGLEGLILAQLLQKIRPDIKILANGILERIRALQEYFFFVNPFGGTAAQRSNIAPIRQASMYLENGGMLATFPSGTVSHFHWQTKEITDPEWSPMIARLARNSEAIVVPIYFSGANSWLFQCVGLIHPLLRTLLLPRELLNKQGREITVHVGKPVRPQKLASFTTDAELIAYLRLRTYILKNRFVDTKKNGPHGRNNRTSAERQLEPIIEPVDSELLTREVLALPTDQTLYEGAATLVLYAHAHQIPNALLEIGRLREIAFRSAGEGSGKSCDLDRFDNYYLHLFTWNKKAKEIVGAYRIGRTDLIVKNMGVRGLYTNTLFQYREHLLAQLGPSLELGRSFVRLEYQKNYSALLNLWKGIGHYVAINPHYRILFGPVSISHEYDDASRQLMAMFLQANNYHPEMAKLIRPRNPHRQRRVRGLDKKTMNTVVRDINEISELITEIEVREQAVPVLLRQYLKLGGQLIGFNVDRDFGDVLDGLLLVDLVKSDHKMLERYLGKPGAETFLEFHRSTQLQTGTD